MTPPSKTSDTATRTLPGDELNIQKMPGHWVLARVGKRVLRPGGLALTRRMLAALRIGRDDHIVEFAPGLGITARMALRAHPAAYTAVERDEAAADWVRRRLTGANQRCVQGTAERTGLADASATVVYGEAMMTMQTLEQKRQILAEAARLLRPGGRYAIHEICLVPDDISTQLVEQIERDLARAIRVGVRPLRRSEWRALLEDAGLRVEAEASNAFALLEPWRLVRDEGVVGTLKIVRNMLCDKQARSRIFEMRRAIRRHADHMQAIMLMAVKP